MGAGGQREMTMAADVRKEVSHSGPRRQSGGVVRAQDSVTGTQFFFRAARVCAPQGITELSVRFPYPEVLLSWHGVRRCVGVDYTERLISRSRLSPAMRRFLPIFNWHASLL